VTTVTVEAQMPDELLQQFLQHLRNFDIYYDPQRVGHIHLEIGVEAPDLSADTMSQIFSAIRPPFTHKIITQGKAEA